MSAEIQALFAFGDLVEQSGIAQRVGASIIFGMKAVNICWMFGRLMCRRWRMSEWLALGVCVGAFMLGLLLGWAVEEWLDDNDPL